MQVLGDDFRYVEPIYRGPQLRTFPDGSYEGLWGERYADTKYPGGAYPEAVYLPYAGIDRVEDLDRSHFPTMDWFDFSNIKSQCASLRQDYVVCFGSGGDMDFMNTIGRIRGLQQVYEDLLVEHPVFMGLLDVRVDTVRLKAPNTMSCRRRNLAGHMETGSLSTGFRSGVYSYEHAGG